MNPKPPNRNPYVLPMIVGRKGGSMEDRSKSRQKIKEETQEIIEEELGEIDQEESEERKNTMTTSSNNRSPKVYLVVGYQDKNTIIYSFNSRELADKFAQRLAENIKESQFSVQEEIVYNDVLEPLSDFGIKE